MRSVQFTREQILGVVELSISHLLSTEQRHIAITSNGMCIVTPKACGNDNDVDDMYICRLNIDEWKRKLSVRNEITKNIFTHYLFWRDDSLFTDVTDEDIEYIKENYYNIFYNWKDFMNGF